MAPSGGSRGSPVPAGGELVPWRQRLGRPSPQGTLSPSLGSRAARVHADSRRGCRSRMPGSAVHRAMPPEATGRDPPGVVTGDTGPRPAWTPLPKARSPLPSRPPSVVTGDTQGGPRPAQTAPPWSDSPSPAVRPVWSQVTPGGPPSCTDRPPMVRSPLSHRPRGASDAQGGGGSRCCAVTGVKAELSGAAGHTGHPHTAPHPASGVVKRPRSRGLPPPPRPGAQTARASPLSVFPAGPV